MTFYKYLEARQAGGHTGHRGTGGVQAHSAGKIFPLRIVIVGGHKKGPVKGTIELHHPEKGVVASKEFTDYGEGPGKFKTVHQELTAKGLEIKKKEGF